jgi:hypothetical protein
MKLFCAALAASILAAGGASAATTVTFGSFQTALNSGESLLTNFSSGLPSDASGDATLFTGSEPNVSAAPAISGTTQTGAQYLNIGGGQSETFIFNPTTDVSFYAGSLDAYNVVTLSDGEIFNGSQIAALTGATANGDQLGAGSNGRFTFLTSAPLTSVTFSSSQAAFEIADVAVSAVPEPGVWVMMLGGLAILGAMLRIDHAYRREHEVAAIATA